MSSNRPPIPVRAGRIGLRRHGDNYPVWVPESEIFMIADRGSDRGPAVRLREDPTTLTPIDATTEELLEACERARAGDAAAKIIADLREEVARLCETIDDLREQIAEELNQEPPTRQRSTPP